jgi:GNAT superfamily N-acetyltransferase
MIRELLEPEFVETFFDLMAEAECGRHFRPGNEAHVRWVRHRIAVHYFRGARFFAFELEDRTPVGFSAVLVDQALEGAPSFGHYSELLDIAFLPDHRGKGYGAELLAHSETFARESGAYCMYIKTYARNNDQIAFYGKAGFVPVATLPDVHGPGDEGTVCMRKLLR